jgi:hypothetical protein
VHDCNPIVPIVSGIKTRDIAKDIADAVAHHVHQNGMVHGDEKLLNAVHGSVAACFTFLTFMAADGLPGMKVSCLWCSGNNSVDVMVDSGQGGVREALTVDNRERKGASALSIPYRVAYKMIKVYLALLIG